MHSFGINLYLCIMLPYLIRIVCRTNGGDLGQRELRLLPPKLCEAQARAKARHVRFAPKEDRQAERLCVLMTSRSVQ